jgi:hypothetical protein
MIWLLAPLLPLLSVSCTGDTQENTEKERQLADGRGAESNDRKKAWSNHSILSGCKDVAKVLDSI